MVVLTDAEVVVDAIVGSYNATTLCRYSFDLTDVQRCITFCLPGCDLQKVPVIDFLHKLKVTYHDMYLNR